MSIYSELLDYERNHRNSSSSSSSSSSSRSSPVTYTSLSDELYGNRRNSSVNLPPLRLRYRPPKPAMMRFNGYDFPVKVPDPDPNFAWVTNRDNFKGSWQPMNSPIKEEHIGRTAFNNIGPDQRYGPQHHGMNSPQESRMSDEELGQKLSDLNLPSEGSREELFARNMRVKHHPTFMQNFASGKPANEAEVADIVGGNQQQLSLGDMGRMRAARSQAGYYENIPAPKTYTPRPPPNIRNLSSPPTPSAGGIAPQAAGEVAAAEEGALAGGAAAAGEAGMMEGAAMMAGRAVPILNLVLMGKMLMDGMGSGGPNNKQVQQELSMRT